MHAIQLNLQNQTRKFFQNGGGGRQSWIRLWQSWQVIDT